METVIVIVLGLAALIGAAVVFGCLRGVDKISKEEDARAAMQMEDDRLSCGLIEED